MAIEDPNFRKADWKKTAKKATVICIVFFILTLMIGFIAGKNLNLFLSYTISDVFGNQLSSFVVETNRVIIVQNNSPFTIEVRIKCLEDNVKYSVVPERLVVGAFLHGIIRIYTNSTANMIAEVVIP